MNQSYIMLYSNIIVYFQVYTGNMSALVKNEKPCMPNQTPKLEAQRGVAKAS